ncbi:general substrate transporter [Cadophora sp. DSE1049]|nr:general substrate transporter [Cadophora sp. DSE1049]
MSSQVPHSRFTWHNTAIVLSLCLGSICYGYDFSIATFTIGQPTFYADMGLTTDPLEAELYAYSNGIIGTILGLFAAGAFFGAIFVGWFSDAHGRKKTLIVAAIINIIGGALQAGSVHVGMFIAARCITGFAAAMFVALVPIYISEVAPPAIRGLLVGQHGASFLMGYSFASWISVGSFFAGPSTFQWRFPVALQILWPALLLIFVRGIPESPRWLISNGHSEEAWDVVARLHYSPTDFSQTFAREEFHQMTSQIAADKAAYGHVTILDLFWKPQFAKRMLASGVVMATSQFTGNLVIYSNIAILYKGLGLSSSISLIVSAAYITWACVCNFANASFLDRLGRVRSMLIGYTSGAIFIAIEAALIATYAGTDNKAGLAAAVAMLFAYITTFAGFCDTTIYVYCAEIFPTHLRAKGMGWSIAVFMASTIPYLETFTLGVSVIGWKYYLVFIAMAIVGVPAIYFLCPETKGLSLEEINGLFGDKVVVQLTHPTDAEREGLDSAIETRQVQETKDAPIDSERSSAKEKLATV